MKIIYFGPSGAINAEQIAAIAPFQSKPVKRLLNAADPSRVLNLTYGYPRRSVLLLNNGCWVITSEAVADLVRTIGRMEEPPDDDPPW